jgi:hypothetical protein
MRPEAPAGALGVDYGDFFPRDRGKGRRIRENSLFRDNSPIYFPILVLFLLFQVCIRIPVVRGKVKVGTVGVNLARSTSRDTRFCVDRRYFADSPKLRQLLPNLGRQCFYDGDILQQFL